MIEIAPRPQRQLLAGERHVAPAEQLGHPPSGREHRARRPRRGQLASRLPLAVGHLLAGAVAHAADQRARRVGVRRPRVAGRQAVPGHGPVEQRQRLVDHPVVAERLREPRVGGLELPERGGVDHRRARHLDGDGTVLGLPRPRAAAALARRVEAADDEDLPGVIAGEAAGDVASGLGPQPARELPLDEPEPRQGGYSPLCASDDLVGTANFEGVLRTVGFSIWPSRLISLIHCLGLRIAFT